MHSYSEKVFADGAMRLVRAGADVSVDVPVQLDRGVELVGADGSFVGRGVTLTWLKVKAPDVRRGDLAQVGSETFIVEQLLADDGHVITVSCMEG